jgi:RNA polymerase sigma factor (sigma-70 family)
MLASQNFNLSEAEFQRLKQGDQRLQTKVFDRYAPTYVRIATGQYGIFLEDAEEIVSSAFAKLFYKILMDAVQKDNLQGYVFTIVKHKCLEKSEQYKKNILENRAEVPDLAHDEPDNELLFTINAAFNRLGERCRKLLGGFYWENKDHKEISTELGITEEASRQRKRECMKKLRVLLGNDTLEKTTTCT